VFLFLFLLLMGEHGIVLRVVTGGCLLLIVSGVGGGELGIVPCAPDADGWHGEAAEFIC